MEKERTGEQGEMQPIRLSELKIDEWAMFSAPEHAPRNRDFQLHEVEPPAGYEEYFERVVLVERLRVVKALTGFTRLLSPGA